MSATETKPQTYLALDFEHVESFADIDAGEILSVLTECVAFAKSRDAAAPKSKLRGGAKILRDQICAAVARRKTISKKRAESGEKGGSRTKQTGAKQSKLEQNKARSDFALNTIPYHEERVVDKSTTPKKQPPTIELFLGGAKLAGVPEDFARPFYSALVAAGWADAEGAYVANWRRYLKSAFLEEQKKISAARGQEGVAMRTLDDFPDAH